MEKKKLDKLVQKYLQMKPLSNRDAITARREYARRELEHSTLRGLRDLGEDTSGEYVPPEVANGLMIPAGRWFKVRCDRFKQTGQHVQIASAEISLF